MIVLVLASCASSTPSSTRVDELSRAPRAGNQVFAATVSGPPGSAVELRFRIDGAKRVWRWADYPGATPVTVPPVRFESGLDIEVLVDGERADPDRPLLTIVPGAERRTETFGSVALTWDTGAGPETLRTTVDATPGPSGGWLVPRGPDASPLVIGVSLAEATRSWHVSAASGDGPKRELSGLDLVAPVGKSEGALHVVDGKVGGIVFLLAAPECRAARERLFRQYGEPTTREPGTERWVGTTFQATWLARGDDCTVAWNHVRPASP